MGIRSHGFHLQSLDAVKSADIATDIWIGERGDIDPADGEGACVVSG